MPFSSLPHEIILHICQYLSHDIHHLNSLLTVNRRLAILLTPVLLDAVCTPHLTERGMKAFYSAIEREDEAAVERLIKRGILQLAGTGRLLNDAIETQSEKVVRKLLEECGIEVGSISHDGQTPLSVAASCGNAPVMKLLLSQPGIDVNAGDADDELARKKLEARRTEDGRKGETVTGR
ncbi:unnamed protein product [Tuber aestivum]|uniref:Uncharacterized protein n=1 Tax=Tuber aestivum TaxID=59557 RepID=A0A292Q380_9PEZI|nr:unnamed protein product [Tuber aestivum]